MKSQIPFNIKLTGLGTFISDINGFGHATSGLTIHFHRKSVGGLAGMFFGPTAIFAILSMISFQINPDVVSLFDMIFKKI